MKKIILLMLIMLFLFLTLSSQVGTSIVRDNADGDVQVYVENIATAENSRAITKLKVSGGSLLIGMKKTLAGANAFIFSDSTPLDINTTLGNAITLIEGTNSLSWIGGGLIADGRYFASSTTEITNLEGAGLSVTGDTLNVSGTNFIGETELDLANIDVEDFSTADANAGYVLKSGGNETINFAPNDFSLLGDVNITGVASGHVLRWNGANWENAATLSPDIINPGTGNNSIWAFGDDGIFQSVSFGATGTVLKSTGLSTVPSFGNIAYSEITGTPTVPTKLTDLDVDTPASGNFIKWTGANWTSTSISLPTDVNWGPLDSYQMFANIDGANTAIQVNSGFLQADNTIDTPYFGNIGFGDITGTMTLHSQADVEMPTDGEFLQYSETLSKWQAGSHSDFNLWNTSTELSVTEKSVYFGSNTSGTNDDWQIYVDTSGNLIFSKYDGGWKEMYKIQ